MRRLQGVATGEVCIHRSTLQCPAVIQRSNSYPAGHGAAAPPGSSARSAAASAASRSASSDTPVWCGSDDRSQRRIQRSRFRGAAEVRGLHFTAFVMWRSCCRAVQEAVGAPCFQVLFCLS